MNRFLSYFLSISIFLLLAACADSKSIHQSQKYFTVQVATMKQTYPGIKEIPIQTQYHFVITWKSNEKPTSFLWKASNEWLYCKVYLIHDINDNNGEEINFNDIKKGDTLSIVPRKGDEFSIPININPALKNVIVFKTPKSNWKYYQMNKIRKLPTVVIP